MDTESILEQIQNLAVQFEELAKTAPEVREAMRHLNQQAKKGFVDPSHVDAIRRGLFTDKLTGGKMGNLAAYEDFLESKPQGVHVLMDGNDFGQVNKRAGMPAGDAAIKQMGNAIREAANETVGQSKSKLFRRGGDEFVLHVPSHEHAAHFARKVREKLDAIPPIAGFYKPSLSIGIGHTPEHADQALIHAKQAKKQMGYPVGQAQQHVHSLVPGKEGPVPVKPQLPLFRPKF